MCDILLMFESVSISNLGKLPFVGQFTNAFNKSNTYNYLIRHLYKLFYMFEHGVNLIIYAYSSNTMKLIFIILLYEVKSSAVKHKR